MSNLSFNEMISPDGEDLFRLAQVVREKMSLLYQLEIRERVRKHPDLIDLGIGVGPGVDSFIDKNLRLTLFLAQSALTCGCSNADLLELLVDTLYRLDCADKANNVLCSALKDFPESSALRRLNALVQLESGDERALQRVADITNSNLRDLEKVALVDFNKFEEWCDRVGNAPVRVAGPEKEISGRFRVCLDGEIKEFDNTIKAKPLCGVRTSDLEVVAGVLPKIGRVGYYDVKVGLPTTKIKSVCLTSKNHVVFDHSNFRKNAVFDGPCIVAGSSYSYFENYFHGLCQVYARIATALNNPEYAHFDILLPAHTPGWGKIFLNLLGIPNDKIRYMPSDCVSIVKDALLLPMKWDICPLEIEVVREKLRKSCPYPKERQNDFYLLREGAAQYTRCLVNEQDFLAIAKEKNFSVVNPVAYPFQKQIEMFGSARTIVTSASSALTNILFAPPGAELILIVPRLFWGMLSTDLATACGHKETAIFGDFVAGARNVNSAHNPYSADPNNFVDLLRHLGRT